MPKIDHCTMFPDRLGAKDWSACCMAHDEAYGGSGTRLVADRELAVCVVAETGWEGLGALMFAGVACFGWLFRRRVIKPKVGKENEVRQRG